MLKNIMNTLRTDKTSMIKEIFSKSHPKYTIETHELAYLLQNDSINSMRILDCSWYLPMENKNAREMYLKERIPYAQYFDIDEVADKSINLPHMMPDEETFIRSMKEMDIRKSDYVICYDMAGVFSAPRAWFTFKVFGLENVFVLNGGFPKWSKEGLPIEKGNDFAYKNQNREKPKDDDFTFKLDKSKIVNMDQILEISMRKQQKLTKEHIIDCRSGPRFRAEVDEPRPTLRLGHVDEADNVFFKEMLDQNNCLKSESEIQKEFQKQNIDLEQPITLYCGTGATACINILALSLIGKYDNCKLYDGSWSEMGNTPEDIINEKLSKIKL